MGQLDGKVGLITGAASGIGAATVLWAVVAGIVEEMLARGLKPTVFPSVNRPDGKESVSQVEADAMRKGY